MSKIGDRGTGQTEGSGTSGTKGGTLVGVSSHDVHDSSSNSFRKRGTDDSSVTLRQMALKGTVTVNTPAGPVDVEALFDTGSETDAISHEKAVEMRSQGVSWGDSGGNLVVANSGEIQPVGSLRLLLTAEPGKVSQGPDPEKQIKIPRSLTFCTDVEIVVNLSSDLIIGYPTLAGTGLLGVVLGQEDFEPDENQAA